MIPYAALAFIVTAACIALPNASLAAQKPDAAGVEAFARNQLDALPANTSFYAKHIGSSRTAAVRADRPMNTMSVIKLAVLVRALREVDAGRLDLSERRTVTIDDVRTGTGYIQLFDPGVALTWHDIVQQMVISSDNTATDLLVARLGGTAAINGMLDSLGFRETRMLRTVLDYFRIQWSAVDSTGLSMSARQMQERFARLEITPQLLAKVDAVAGKPEHWIGRTTAREISTLLEGILFARYTTRASADSMLAMLKRQQLNSRLPQRLAGRTGVSIGHKTGDFPPFVGNDVGILFYRGGPAIVSVFVTDNRGDFAKAEATIGRLAERVVDHWR